MHAEKPKKKKEYLYDLGANNGILKWTLKTQTGRAYTGLI